MYIYIYNMYIYIYMYIYNIIKTIMRLLTYMLAGSLGHRPRNVIVFCLWPCSPSLYWWILSPLFLFLLLCQVFRGLPLRLFSWGFHVIAWLVMVLEVSWVCVLSTSISLLYLIYMGGCLVHFQQVVLVTLSDHERVFPVYFYMSPINRVNSPWHLNCKFAIWC